LLPSTTNPLDKTAGFRHIAIDHLPSLSTVLRAITQESADEPEQLPLSRTGASPGHVYIHSRQPITLKVLSSPQTHANQYRKGSTSKFQFQFHGPSPILLYHPKPTHSTKQSQNSTPPSKPSKSTSSPYKISSRERLGMCAITLPKRM
jgi:hypothetical protein